MRNPAIARALFQLGVLAWDTHMWDCNTIPRLMLEHRSATHECKVVTRLNGVGVGQSVAWAMQAWVGRQSIYRRPRSSNGFTCECAGEHRVIRRASAIRNCVTGISSIAAGAHPVIDIN